MAFIKINGVAIPTPSGYVPSIMDISKAERNANGTMIIDRIATKRKLELSYNYLTQQQMSNILIAVSPVFFTVEYMDPQEGVLKTGTFYAGDRNCPVLKSLDGIFEYKDFKISLIER